MSNYQFHSEPNEIEVEGFRVHYADNITPETATRLALQYISLYKRERLTFRKSPEQEFFVGPQAILYVN